MFYKLNWYFLLFQHNFLRDDLLCCLKNIYSKQLFTLDYLVIDTHGWNGRFIEWKKLVHKFLGEYSTNIFGYQLKTPAWSQNFDIHIDQMPHGLGFLRFQLDNLFET